MVSMKETVAVLYGGVSPEHEVAIISAVQAMNALKGEGYTVVPVYISKEGEWYLGDDKFLNPTFYQDLNKVKKAGKMVLLPANRNLNLLISSWLGFGPYEKNIDVFFPIFHGANGEDGTIQGLLEMANLPYVGGGVLEGSSGMDKFVTKRIAESLGVRVAGDRLVVKGMWSKEKLALLKRDLKYPVFVKPATLGSSIGISRVERSGDLDNALEVAFCYDERVLVEDAVDMETEVNISVLGNGPYEVSVTEQPVASSKVLSFEDKYISSAGKQQGMASAKRVIPANISSKQLKTIEDWARQIFWAMGGRGLARVDFMIDKKGEIYFNEINTIPGSLAFYLWERSGYPFPKLVSKLVELALESWKRKQQRVTVFESNILSGLGRLGVKGKA